MSAGTDAGPPSLPRRRRPERGPRRATPVAGVPSRSGRPLQNLDRVSTNPESRRRKRSIIQRRESKIACGSGPGGAKEFRNNEPLRNSAAKTFYDASYEIRYLDAHLASVVFAITTYEGGAHPNGGSIGLLFDLDQARPLQLADFLANAEEAIPAIAARVERMRWKRTGAFSRMPISPTSSARLLAGAPTETECDLVQRVFGGALRRRPARMPDPLCPNWRAG
jgi:hypothetical protein